MLSEISSFDFEDRGYIRSFSHPSPSPSHFHEQIFSQTYDYGFTPMKTVINCNPHNRIGQKVQKVFSNSPVGANVGGEIKVDFEWGGKDGPSVSGSASASASDDNGNKVTVTAEVNNDGSGKVSASASHKDNKSSK